MHLVNLFLAGIWLLLGVCLFAYERLAPGGGVPHIPYTDLSYGWLAMALAGYNILRWWRNMERMEG